MAQLTEITAGDWSRADPITKMRVDEIVSGLERGDYTPSKLAIALRALVVAAVDHEREACAKIADVVAREYMDDGRPAQDVASLIRARSD